MRIAYVLHKEIRRTGADTPVHSLVWLYLRLLSYRTLFHSTKIFKKETPLLSHVMPNEYKIMPNVTFMLPFFMLFHHQMSAQARTIMHTVRYYTIATSQLAKMKYA